MPAELWQLEEKEVAAVDKDRLLMNKLADRDMQAMADLYDRYYWMVWNIACRSQKDSAACERIVCSVFKQLWKQPQDFSGDKKLAVLILQCCRSTIKEMHEKQFS